jgi:hypothetical protein
VVKPTTKALEFSWANHLWMTDGMWRPSVPLDPGGKPVRTHLPALLDDSSRPCKHEQHYASTTSTASWTCSRNRFRFQARGIPEKLYTDNARCSSASTCARCAPTSASA